MEMYSVTTSDKLRSLCVRQNWFTEGTNEQYNKLFRVNEENAPIEEIATIIWLCSDNKKYCRQDILQKLKEAREEYYGYPEDGVPDDPGEYMLWNEGEEDAMADASDVF